MPIWKTASVEDNPEVLLTQWIVIEVTSPLWEGKSRHFVGYNAANREGRVSSQILAFDKKTMQGKTKSGRIYKLVGESSLNADAIYVYRMWARHNQIRTEKEVNIMGKKKGGGCGK